MMQKKTPLGNCHIEGWRARALEASGSPQPKLLCNRRNTHTLPIITKFEPSYTSESRRVFTTSGTVLPMYWTAGACFQSLMPSGEPENHLPQREQAMGTSSLGGRATRTSQQHSCTAHLQQVVGQRHSYCVFCSKQKQLVARPEALKHTMSLKPWPFSAFILQHCIVA